MKYKYGKITIRLIGIGLVVTFLWLTYHYFEGSKLLDHFHLLLTAPDKLTVMFVVYGVSFWLRALVWKSYVGKDISLTVYLKGLFMSLLINHLAPMKIGDIARVAVLAKQRGVSVDESIHSVAVMRIMDMLVLCLFSACGMYMYLNRFPIRTSMFIFLGITGTVMIVAVLLRKWNVKFIRKHMHMFLDALVGRRGVYIVSFIAFSWICEAIVIYEMANMLGLSLSIFESVWVNSVTVSGQVFQIAPGGLATYEAVMAFAITRIVPLWDKAYMAAIVTHAFKFAFSYIIGLVVFVASPKEVQLVRSLLKKEVREYEKSIKS
ncbi:lysylphosphatidylglycerol synthase transmembrane domain-containing protein [Thermaerobacillus caldiproteolyticus]|uniref:lysylphosphatidylglycerol synthase transmembrane domain-containing protein n=1 Tax=Thermaerobacillus caldiproteolyticus TaxID=247480 RepID=UPI00188AC42F|nr:lysylphosphatidylglycerol synthase transmembrane domain-containing protein [Anoxybacillus caldiproteolyticus]QPA30290.1 flippase-like domain-containing protein [Anoxybacillus caldiproteolyticus]